MTQDAELQRRLGVGDATVIGAGSMIGAGVFAAWGPAAGAAGTGLLVGLVIAAVIASCNAASSAQLASLHPESGGTYVYARARLGPGWGHLAGWGFVVGKTASCAAMALTAGAYLWPGQERLVAVGAVASIVAVNLGGLSRTVAVTKALLVVASVTLVTVVASGSSSVQADLGRITPIEGDPVGILGAAGFMFFAFAGYARIATLGEEVRDPARTIPRAILFALTAVLAVYAVVGVTVLAVVPIDELANSAAPLQAVVEGGPLDAFAPVVRVGAGIAALGVLLNLVPGVSRTVLAMARRRELPRWFATVHHGRSLPVRAELTVALVVGLIVATLDIRGAIGFSSVTVLTYYAITNASALTLRADERRFHPAVAVVGLVGCSTVALALPRASVLAGAGVMLLGFVARRVTMLGSTDADPT